MRIYLDFFAGQRREVATSDRVAEIKLAELGCMDQSDILSVRQKRLGLTDIVHVAAPLRFVRNGRWDRRLLLRRRDHPIFRLRIESLSIRFFRKKRPL